MLLSSVDSEKILSGEVGSQGEYYYEVNIVNNVVTIGILKENNRLIHVCEKEDSEDIVIYADLNR